LPRAGDLLYRHDGQTPAVEDLLSAREQETICNL
jgi:hypothetical protein